MRYFTKEWYELVQKYGHTFNREKKSERKKQLDAISAAFHQAAEREDLPKELLEKFSFHDGEIRDVQQGEDYIIEVRSPFSRYARIIFCNAVVKQDSIPAGAVWLYEELYRHALGYEAHILCESSLGLRDTKIICKDILFDEGPQDDSTD